MGGRVRQRMRRAGYTLLELMVVMLILALIASVAAPRVTKYLRKAKTDTAKIQVDALSTAVDSFLVDVGRYPTNEEGLGALMQRPADATSWNGPYLKKANSLIDPWGRSYHYKIPGRDMDFDVYTLGADGKEGGESDAADIGNW